MPSVPKGCQAGLGVCVMGWTKETCIKEDCPFWNPKKAGANNG